jgi:hypothetical protein
MAFPNLIALFVLSGIVSKTSRDFWKKYKTLEGFERHLSPGSRDSEP